jgi:hypothetical protein
VRLNGRIRVAVILALMMSPARVARAQLGADGTPITTSDYTVDLSRGPVISTSRVTGLSGAATAIAEGVEGGLQNPAAVAWRGPQWPDWYDYWLAFGITYPFDTGDFYNSGNVTGGDPSARDDAEFLFFIPGAYWQMWNFGLGLTVDSQRVTLDGLSNASGAEPDRLRLRFTTFHIQLGYGFFDGQLILGAGLRLLRERILVGEKALGKEDEAYAALGLGSELGVMFRPHGKRYRLGASFYPSIDTGGQRRGNAEVDEDGNIVVDGIYLPKNTELPHTGAVGFAYQFGPRPTNPPWIDVKDFAAEDLARLARREAELRRAEEGELAAVRARGGPDLEACLADVRSRYAQKYDRVDQQRKDIEYAAWKTLRERYRNEWPRWYFLITTDLQITGRVRQGVGVESFIFQTVQRSGQNVTVSPKLGVETEAWPKRLKLRAGTYMEPSRFAASEARWHGTFGADLRVLNWDVFGLWPEDYLWQISTALDFAPGYRAVSLGIGGWY